MPRDISVETFDVNVGDGSTHTLVNDVGDLSRAFVRINNSSDKSSAGPTGDTSNCAPRDAHCGIQLTSTNQLTFYAGTSTPRKHVGEVWRYVGEAGGPNEFIVRGQYVLDLGSGTSASAAVAGIVNEDKCVPYLCGVSTTDGSNNNFDHFTFGVRMDGSGNVVASRGSGISGTALVYVTVVEYTGSNWSVGHGRHNSHDGGDFTISLNTAADGTSGLTFDVGDWSTAIIEATHEGDTGGERGLADIMYAVEPGNNTTTVAATFREGDPNARNDGEAFVHVIKHPDLVVNRGSSINFDEGDNSYGTPIAFPAGASEENNIRGQALEWYPVTSGTGTAHKRGSLGARIVPAGDAALGTSYADGAAFESSDYNSSQTATFTWDVTFPATPTGVLLDAGGTGTGTGVYFMDNGDFIARAGNGGQSWSANDPGTAGVLVPPSTYDFAGKSGRLTVRIDMAEESVSVTFDEGKTGTDDFYAEHTAPSGISNWSGGNSGFVGNSNGVIAGSDITSNYDFNGTITSFWFKQGVTIGDRAIQHWVHRAGNTVDAWYGIIDMNLIQSSTPPVFDGSYLYSPTDKVRIRNASGQKASLRDHIGSRWEI